jgi:hypothetical protein
MLKTHPLVLLEATVRRGELVGRERAVFVLVEPREHFVGHLRNFGAAQLAVLVRVFLGEALRGALLAGSLDLVGGEPTVVVRVHLVESFERRRSHLVARDGAVAVAVETGEALASAMSQRNPRGKKQAGNRSDHQTVHVRDSLSGFHSLQRGSAAFPSLGPPNSASFGYH